MVAQSMYLLHVYVPMPPPRGDTFGLERWHGVASAAATAAHHSSHSSETPRAYRPGTSADSVSAPSAAGVAGATKKRRNVLIIGDSLVVGIGCKETLVLPQGICRQISDLLQVDISWRAVGVNGGDVRTIHQEVLDTVKRFQQDRESRYREYLASLPLPPSASSSSPAPNVHGQAAGAGIWASVGSTSAAAAAPTHTETMPVLASNAAEKSQFFNTRGAGAVLFDFVRTHFNFAERGGAGGGGEYWGAQGDVTFEAASRDVGMVSEPSPTG